MSTTGGRVSAATAAGRAEAAGVRVHAIQTGRLVGNLTFLRSERWSSLLRRPQPFAFPVFSYIVEHPDGLIAIDAGLAQGVRVPRAQRRFAPTPAVEAGEEIGPQMRARGLSPGDVRLVVLTHLDWDHVGGLSHFPLARVLVHRPEREAAATFGGRQRYQTGRWPTGFAPAIYDLDPEPYGPFPASRAVTADGDVRIVPIPGHSAGQVGVIVERPGGALLFSADHTLRQDWFVEDLARGRLVQLGIWHRGDAIETSRRIQRLANEVPTVLLPAHDADAPARLARMEPVRVPAPAVP